MLWIFKPQVVGNLTDRFRIVKNPFFRYIDYFGLDILLCRHAGFFFD